MPGASSLALAQHDNIKNARNSCAGRKLPAKSVVQLMKWQFGHDVPNRMKAYRVIKNLEGGDNSMGGSLSKGGSTSVVNTTIKKPSSLILSVAERNYQIGFIGLDMVAKRMATRLVSEAGRKLKVWDHYYSNCEAFAKENDGCEVSYTPQEVVESCDVIYVALADIESSIYVYHG